MECMCAQTRPRFLLSWEFWENGVRTHVNSKGSIPSIGKKISSEEDRTHGAASRCTVSPTYYLYTSCSCSANFKDADSPSFSFRLTFTSKPHKPRGKTRGKSLSSCFWFPESPLPQPPPSSSLSGLRPAEAAVSTIHPFSSVPEKQSV